MKLEVNVDKKYFFAFILIGLVVIGIVGVVAYNANPTSTSGAPATFGHSVDEINWGQTIPSIVATNISANRVCIGTDCRTVWPTGGSGVPGPAGPAGPAGGGYTLPIATVGTATTGTLGGVKLDGTTITITPAGVISATGAGSQWSGVQGGNIRYEVGNVSIGTSLTWDNTRLYVMGNTRIQGNLTVIGQINRVGGDCYLADYGLINGACNGISSCADGYFMKGFRIGQGNSVNCVKAECCRL